MSQSQNWVELIGKHLKHIYAKLDDIDQSLSRINNEISHMNNEIKNVEEKFETDIKLIKEITLTKEDFDDFVEDITNTLIAIPLPESTDQNAQL